MGGPARIDVLTIFPDYLAPLDLSLVGRARRSGLLDLRVHDLRAWATDAHRTVDDTPAGGGAGMVMRPDVWGRALDDVLGLTPGGGGVPEHATHDVTPPSVLVVPTPAGAPFSQDLAGRLASQLADGAHLVLACGRYEGIDSRVTEHYASLPGVAVHEVSIGDYVLNGGEVAALAMIEAIARLLPGMLGNPESLAEESHGPAGLLEGPVYTRPLEWRGHDVPEVLRSGHHGRIARWRRDAALTRTAERRPDLLERLDVAALDRADRRHLARLGRPVVAGRLRRADIRRATPEDAADLAALAAATFPLACPPGSDPAAVAEHVATHLSEAAFARLLDDGARYLVLVAAVADPEPGEALIGYTLAVLPRDSGEGPADPDVAAVVGVRPVAELSKCYVRAAAHGSGLADALLAATHERLARVRVAGEPLRAVWLGTNAGNRRARRFYARAGYAVVGHRRFMVGPEPNRDVVMVRPLH